MLPLILLLAPLAVAASHPAPAPAPAPELPTAEDAAPPVAPAPAPPPVEKQLVPWAGLAVGASAAGSALGTGLATRVEVGAHLPWTDRIGPYASLHLAATKATGVGTDDRFEDPYSWTTHQRFAAATLGLDARLLPSTEAIVPEITVGPSLFLVDTSVGGRVAGEEFPATADRYARVGVSSTVGLCGLVGPGEIAGGVGLAWVPLRAALVGDVAMLAVTPSIGFRMPL